MGVCLDAAVSLEMSVESYIQAANVGGGAGVWVGWQEETNYFFSYMIVSLDAINISYFWRI